MLIAPYEKIDERKKISKSLKKEAVTAVCQPLREQETSRWIRDYIKGLGITAEREVTEMLEVEFSGNLDILKNELHKYALFVGKGGNVTSEVANKLTSQSINHTSLRLADAVMENNLQQAI
ncbi:MAG TPA: DNA polymerase III subunit delta, partial [Bacillota bacterium]|nr:DNA polymerase III subunit delta [Bacillota bacterium]